MTESTMNGSPAPTGGDTRAARQLDALRSTYPAHDIEHGSQWTARLRRPLTQKLRNAGVHELIEQADAESLASTLAHQTRLLHAQGS
ncbi:hypothetical protein ETD86_13080 [Nonomuraea turkmeniaca]|uniref:Uncharacterized protein n=1 Tax=Nonomuraea turkmeniaca TaxID=103838 RepID=A0A5S4FN42_9ACTN|nr:hypothetical protein [Nonomuraea turkmeniaca]TMR22096.1 hypothetical protein ETD86_13080 [Nonomuraea turkmeniaca]